MRWALVNLQLKSHLFLKLAKWNSQMMEDIFLLGLPMARCAFGRWVTTFIKMFLRLYKPWNFRMISGSTIQYFCLIMNNLTRSTLNTSLLLSKILLFQILLLNLKILQSINNSKKTKMMMRFKISTKEKTLSNNNNYNKIYRTIRENRDKFNSKCLYLNSIKISF